MDNTADHDSGVFVWMADHPLPVIGAAVLVTALLAIPFLTMAPTSSASQEPGGAIFDARDAIEDRFVSAVFSVPFIVESRDGNILAKANLMELRDNTSALRADPDIGPTLLSYYEPTTESDVVGVRTIADLVDSVLPGGLDSATDVEVANAVGSVIEELGPTSEQLGLSTGTRFDEAARRWVSPALITNVLADNDALGFVVSGVTLGSDTAPEEYSRTIQAAIRGDERTIQVWGIAIDVNLTSQDQGAAAGPFIGFTILAVLIVVGIVFRSYWALALTGGALGALIIWLYGISNLIGLEDDLILSLIVPIAMISFGVDFMFHALGRYREERHLGLPPTRAFAVGMTAVIGALTLALLSDMAAFLANASSGIESLVQFGIATSIALIAAYLLLGIVTPLAFGAIEDRIGTPPRSRLRSAGRVAAQTAAGLVAMTIVLLMVYLSPPAGVALLAIYVAFALVVPALLSKSRPTEHVDTSAATVGRVAVVLGASVAWFASRRAVVLPVAAIVMVGATFLAVQVPTEFDVKDFFTADSDFVVSLDKVEEHLGERGGEPATIYIEADLTDPLVVSRLSRFRENISSLEVDGLAIEGDGATFVEGSVLEVIENVWSSPIALSAITQRYSIELSDNDSDGIPDTSAQLAAVYAHTREAGVAADATRFLLTPNDVRQRVWISEDSMEAATTFTVALTNTRRQESVVEARDAIAPLIESLESDLSAMNGESVVVLTGGPIVRQAGLNAVSRALQFSLPIAVFLCFLIAAAFMRSFRFAAVSVVPILITVSLLYAFMEVAGYSINIVTATIGAVSIGIGIDFAIHFTMRYREELEIGDSREGAVQRTGEGTGIALLSSAVSSVVGFFILAFAPMPMFASYGLLTAVMISMAVMATFLVLPSLLVLATPERTARA